MLKIRPIRAPLLHNTYMFCKSLLRSADMLVTAMARCPPIPRSMSLFIKAKADYYHRRAKAFAQKSFIFNRLVPGLS